MVDETERPEIARRISAGIVTRLYDLAVVGGAPASGLANRVAEIEKSLVITWDPNSGNPVIEFGGQRSHFTREGLDVLARAAFKDSPLFAEEAAVWLDRRSKQFGFNSRTVTQLFPKPDESARKEAERRAAAHEASWRGAF